MTILTEGSRKADFLVSEANGDRSRGVGIVTVPANTTEAAGTVMGQLTATDKFVRHAAGGADGSENETAVLFENLVNETGAPVDYDVTLIMRDAEVNQKHLTYEVGADAAQETASNAALAALGIVAR